MTTWPPQMLCLRVNLQMGVVWYAPSRVLRALKRTPWGIMVGRGQVVHQIGKGISKRTVWPVTDEFRGVEEEEEEGFGRFRLEGACWWERELSRLEGAW